MPSTLLLFVLYSSFGAFDPNFFKANNLDSGHSPIRKPWTDLEAYRPSSVSNV